MKVSILGPGAIGRYLGGLLALSGHAVSFGLPDSARKAAGTRSSGPRELSVRIVHPDGWLIARGIRTGLQADPDVLFVTLGRQHLRAMKKDSFRGIVDPEHGHTLFCNSDPAEPERLGFSALSRAFLLTLMEASALQDGEVEVFTRRPVIIAEKLSPMAELAEGLERFGVSVQFAADVVSCLNSFFVYQLLSLPASLCNTTLDHFLTFTEGRELAKCILSEGLKLMQRTGRRTARLPIMDPQALMERMERDHASFQAARFKPGRSYPPVLQDSLEGKPTEAKELNKRAVELASAAGLQMPWNWKVFQKAGRALTVGYYRDPAELLRSLS